MNVLALPQFSTASATAFVNIYGALSLLTLLLTLPTWRKFYLSEKWGGYGEPIRSVEILQNPIVMPVVLVAWMTALAGLMFGIFPLASAMINAGFAYYFFIFMRWRGLLRGMGAPGFMIYWGSIVCLALLLLTPGSLGWQVGTLAFQVDLAIIFISAGVSKLVSGYFANHGMELGMVNPMWGYAWRFTRRFKPANALFWLLNESAWSMQILGGMLCIYPPTRIFGALIFALMFTSVGLMIRLGPLCPMIVGCLILFIPNGSLVDSWMATWPLRSLEFGQGPVSGWLDQLAVAFFTSYLVIRPVVTVGLFYNYLAKRKLPGPGQAVMDFISNTFGFILWRVFTADLLDFYIQIYRDDGAGGDRVLISRYDQLVDARYNQVAEAIAVTSLFTTLRYFPTNKELFDTRLRRYARSLTTGSSKRLIFEYTRIFKQQNQFASKVIANVILDLATNVVTEESILSGESIRALPAYSKIAEGLRPGSYVPKAKAGINAQP